MPSMYQTAKHVLFPDAKSLANVIRNLTSDQNKSVLPDKFPDAFQDSKVLRQRFAKKVINSLHFRMEIEITNMVNAVFVYVDECSVRAKSNVFKHACLANLCYDVILRVIQMMKIKSVTSTYPYLRHLDDSYRNFCILYGNIKTKYLRNIPHLSLEMKHFRDELLFHMHNHKSLVPGKIPLIKIAMLQRLLKNKPL